MGWSEPLFLGTPGVSFFGVVGVPDKILSVSPHLLSRGSEQEGQGPSGVAQLREMGKPVTPPAFLQTFNQTPYSSPPFLLLVVIGYSATS